MTDDAPHLITLHRMGQRWYAGVRTGNLTVGGLDFGAPTAFPSSMSRADVLAAMRRLTPDLVVEPRAEEGER